MKRDSLPNLRDASFPSESAHGEVSENPSSKLLVRAISTIPDAMHACMAAVKSMHASIGSPLLSAPHVECIYRLPTSKLHDVECIYRLPTSRPAPPIVLASYRPSKATECEQRVEGTICFATHAHPSCNLHASRPFPNNRQPRNQRRTYTHNASSSIPSLSCY